MLYPFSVLAGKMVRYVARLRGGGSALPGLFVEKIDPSFISRTLSQLPLGVVLVSGTNGKTTTTKMIVELLEGQGLRVFTNRTGSNFTRGVAAALLGDISVSGKLNADIAVLELDEAHAVHFARAVAPTYAVFLNVMRDQLDRFGEIDTTAKLLTTVAEHTTSGLILNREDPRVAAIAQTATKSRTVSYFGLDVSLLPEFPTDEALHNTTISRATTLPASVTLDALTPDGGTFTLHGTQTTVPLKINGIYNIFNAAAALATLVHVRGDKLDTNALFESLSHITPAFGRGETVMVDGQPLELVLVKNPSGFRLGLSSFLADGYKTMIAINDNYADGRDMSWLWDVGFESLRSGGVAYVSGVRAYDMAVRLKYEDVAVDAIGTNLVADLRNFISRHTTTPKRIYCTYTAMLTIRKELEKIASVKGFNQ